MQTGAQSFTIACDSSLEAPGPFRALGGTRRKASFMHAVHSAKGRHVLASFAALMIFWALLNATLAPDVLIVGAVVALSISVLFQSGLSFFSEFRFTPAAIGMTVLYFIYFFIELTKANLKLAAIVLTPSLPIKPGLVKVRTSSRPPWRVCFWPIRLRSRPAR